MYGGSETHQAPEISIILPAYNAQAFLDETIGSVLQQTFQGWELIIVDDGSKDATLEIARRYENDPRISVFEFDNGGEALARTRGYKRSNSCSELVMFLDHDDRLNPNFLSTLRDAAKRSPKAVGVYCNGQIINMVGEKIVDDLFPSYNSTRRAINNGKCIVIDAFQPTTFAVLSYACCISSMSSCLLRRCFLPLEGLFRTDMRTGSADLHLYLRLAMQGDFIFVDELLFEKRQHANNITNNQEAVDASVLRALQLVANLPETDSSYSALLKCSYKLRQKEKVFGFFREARHNAHARQFKWAVIASLRGLKCYTKAWMTFS